MSVLTLVNVDVIAVPLVVVVVVVVAVVLPFLGSVLGSGGVVIDACHFHCG